GFRRLHGLAQIMDLAITDRAGQDAPAHGNDDEQNLAKQDDPRGELINRRNFDPQFAGPNAEQGGGGDPGPDAGRPQPTEVSGNHGNRQEVPGCGRKGLTGGEDDDQNSQVGNGGESLGADLQATGRGLGQCPLAQNEITGARDYVQNGVTDHAARGNECHQDREGG